MKKKWMYGPILLAAILVLGGCMPREADRPEEPPAEVESEAPLEDLPEEGDPTDPPTTEEPSESLFRSELTGLPVDREVLDKRPVAVMLDNHIGARPQSGLAEAEVVFEFLAEGNITRYMAVLQEADLNSIGPVRSARPYFIDKALEFDPLYVHVGGSVQALEDIETLQMADIDGMNRGGDTFWRTNHKKIPHNMYTSTEALRAAAERSGYRESFDIEFPEFNEEDRDWTEGAALERIRFGFSRYYKPAFVYDAENGFFRRLVKDSPHLEEFTDQPVTAKNLLVLRADTRVIDQEGRLAIKTVGSGTGLYATNGRSVEITWEKTDRRSGTVYRVGEEPLLLNPGNTWIVVIPQALEVERNY